MIQYKNTIPAEAERQCDCCGRIHRKLICIDGFWMGQTCAGDYKLYLRNDGKDINSILWKGHEKVFLKVEKMVKGKLHEQPTNPKR